ncbi:MAG: hypothetical protein GYA55_12495 [SAR324 cluster bacterium]|uniref:Uncharacterized protein n=1 Tax=SAR324 cluster bacterium TaxID=2024889 RepID=A0A7X9ILB1_9DELT|nr:hypothetical protein [SAR324 cluster bacterium]
MSKKELSIEISRAFKSLGFFRPEELTEGFESGKFVSGDYGRYEDSGEWRPIEVVVSELKPAKAVKRTRKATTPNTTETKTVTAVKKKDQIIERLHNFFNYTPSSNADRGGILSASYRHLIGFLKEVVARF